MKLQEAERLAKKLIAKHCTEFVFKWDNAKCRFGQCNHYKKEISLSKKLVKINSEERVKDTILHEIAHALTPGNNHNKIWKAKCLSLGGNGEIYISLKKTNTITPKYKYECPNCGKKIFQHKKTNKKSACSNCCRKFNFGKYSKEYIFKYTGIASKEEYDEFIKKYNKMK